MDETVDIYLFGSLAKPRDGKTNLEVPLGTTVPVIELIRRLGLTDQVQLVMVNRRAVEFDTPVKAGDRLALFPQEYPVFPDWNDFRMVEES